MNCTYGESSHYGARSSYISELADTGFEVHAIARSINRGVTVDDIHATVKEIRIPYRYQIVRAINKILCNRKGTKRGLWAGFDFSLKAHVKKANDIVLMHTWEYVPKTVSYLRRTNPKIIVLRDIVISREYEYFSGASIKEEDAFADYFLSPSTFTTEKLVSWGIDERKIFEVPFGVDTEKFKPSTITDDRAAIRFAFSGGISKRKGCDTLLEAWKKANLQNAELHLYGPIRDEMNQQIDNSRNVVAHGFVRLENELNKNDVFVFPSTLEGSAKSVYEALACGLPVITTREAGSVVRQGTDGYIVEVGNVDQLVIQMTKMYSDANLRFRLGKNARSQAESFTWEAYANRISNVYDKLLSDASIR